jgi:hypothetical protein
MQRLRSAGTAVIVAVAITACAGTGLTPSETVTTAMQGWEHYFRLEWTAQARHDGIEIDGYAYNLYGAAMANVQLLAQALDPANNVVAQKLVWVPGGVPPFGRAYFKISALPPAHQYRATVWAFDIVDDFPRRRF